MKQLFQLKKWEVHSWKFFDDETADVDAVLRIQVGKKIVEKEASGVGPVDALANILRQALKEFYPAIEEITLEDYSCHIEDRERGTAAKVRVLIKLQRGEKMYSAEAVSQNIIEASWEALVEGFSALLIQEVS